MLLRHEFILFACLISATQVKTQSIGDYLLRPASTLSNSLTSGHTSEQGQNPDRNERPAQSQVYSTNDQSVNSHQTAESCASYLAYQTYSGNYVGVITIINPNRSKNVVKITLTVAAQVSSNYYGSIELVKHEDSTVNEINNGQPLSYRINFPLQNPLPKLVSVILNDQKLCSSLKEGDVLTTLMLEYTYTTGLSDNYNSQRPSLQQVQTQHTQPQQVQYVQQTTRVTQRYTQNTPPTVFYTQASTRNVQNINNLYELDCGVPDYQAPAATGLVFDGRFANRGQFPWLAALYHNGNSETGFICGGSLISSKIIITAAHCIQPKGDNTTKTPEESTFYLGKHNLETLNEQYFTTSGVAQFAMHPDWKFHDLHSYDADIAVAILIRTILFNKFLKPICMWTGSNSHDDLVGHKGTIAGWGKTEYSALATDRPKWAKITVVNAVTCLRSNNAFNDLTSDRTFCAGERNGVTGPCNGDSGGGFVVENNNKWYLRGIISASLLADGVCDTRNYAVFTDVQKFSSWIRSYVQSYK